MTTIAFDAVTLAADTMGDWGGLPVTEHKIARCGEYVYAGCGSTVTMVAVRQWLAAGCPGGHLESPLFEEGGSWGVAIHEPTGEVYCPMGRVIYLTRLWDIPTADGGGRDFAISAMAFGKGAADAVRFAMRFQVGSGGGVDTYDVETKTLRIADAVER